MATALSHITFVVRDLDKTGHMLHEVFHAVPLYESGAKEFSLSAERFYSIGGVWVCIMQGEPLPCQSYNHVAFHVQEQELDACEARVRALGLPIRPGRQRVEGEGRSLYFYDYDNHLFELHTGELSTRLQAYKTLEKE